MAFQIEDGILSCIVSKLFELTGNVGRSANIVFGIERS